jgi:hypothetical protein
MRRSESVHEVHDRPGARRFRALDAVVCVLVAGLLVALLQGPSILRAGERMDPGIQRTMVLAVGHPAGWLADGLGTARIGRDATAWLSPDEHPGDRASFAGPPPATAPGQLPRRSLETVLVTGDSLATPLDAEIARRLAARDGVKVIREPHLGTGISKSLLVDWSKLSARQVAANRPDAVVVFIGANEGFAMAGPGGKPVECCGRPYAAVFAKRVRRMMDTYRQDGAARVYWLTLPAPRDRDRREIATTVNAAIAVAASPFRSQVRVLDTVIDVGGRPTIVRESDGIHLNRAGAKVAADRVLRLIGRDFGG